MEGVFEDRIHAIVYRGADQSSWMVGVEWNCWIGEFENYGPGANTSMRVKWPGYSLMNSSQALNFTAYNFTMADTWLPDTDIPFCGGLIYTN